MGSGFVRCHRSILLCLVTALMLFAAACGGPLSQGGDPETPAIVQPSRVSVQVTPGTPGAAVTATFSPTSTADPALASLLEKDMSVEQSPERLSTPVVEEISDPQLDTAYRICSPLAIHPLEELPEIISDPYHPPPPGKEERHQGVDFSYYQRGDRSSIRGVGVQSVLTGTVAAAISDTFPFGNMVIIETSTEVLPAGLVNQLEIGEGESLYVLYAHLEGAPQVSEGEAIAACQLLGEVGMSGNAGVPHLHIETRLGPVGTRFDGMRFYDTLATQEQRENYLLWRTSGVFRHFDPMQLLLYDIAP